MNIKDWWKGQFQSPASQQKSASEVTTTVPPERAQLSSMNHYWAQEIKNKIRIEEAELRAAEENARYKMEKKRQMLDKLNDPEYVKQQYNMPLSDREFVDWLRGAVDLVGDEPPTKEQWGNIKTGIARVIAKRMLDTKEVEYVRGQVYKNPYTVTSTNPYANTASAMSVAYNNANIGEWMLNKGPGI